MFDQGSQLNELRAVSKIDGWFVAQINIVLCSLAILSSSTKIVFTIESRVSLPSLPLCLQIESTSSKKIRVGFSDAFLNKAIILLSDCPMYLQQNDNFLL